MRNVNKNLLGLVKSESWYLILGCFERFKKLCFNFKLMDYREKWFNKLRELGQFDIGTIREVVATLDGVQAPGAKFLVPINENLAIFFRRGKSCLIEILRKKPDSPGYSCIYCHYYPQERLDNLSTEIKEKVTQALEDFYNRSKDMEAGRRRPVKKLYGDQELPMGLEDFLRKRMSDVIPYQEGGIKLIISNFIIEENRNKDLNPEILFYKSINVGILEKYQLAGRTYYRLRKKSSDN